MKQLASVLCLILLVFSICANGIITVSATETIPSTDPVVEESQPTEEESISIEDIFTETIPSTDPVVEESQPTEEESISIEDIFDAFSRLINNGKQWVETQKERIPEEVIDILKLLMVARWILQD